MNLVILSKSAAIYSTYSLLKAADQRGHFVQIIDYSYCDIGIEDNEPVVYFDGEKLENIDFIIPRIASSATVHGATLLRHFEWMGVMSCLKADSLVNARDKIISLQILGAAGIEIPNTVSISNSTYYTEILERIKNYPKILKLASGTQGLGIVKSDTKSNLESIVESFTKLNQRIIVQEFIKEVEGSDLRVIVVGGKIVAAMVRKAQHGEFRSNLHRGGESYTTLLNSEEKKVALKAAIALDLEFAGVDILRSNRGPLVIEVNASPGLEGIETTTNIKVASQVISYCEQKFQNNNIQEKVV